MSQAAAAVQASLAEVQQHNVRALLMLLILLELLVCCCTVLLQQLPVLAPLPAFSSFCYAGVLVLVVTRVHLLWAAADLLADACHA